MTTCWGILGTGGIARKFVDGLQQVADQCPVVAVGSRQLASAETFAQGRMQAHGSYDALLADPNVDVVYVALLNHQHAEWCIRAVEAGKHVLCEKPAAMTAAELETVLAACATHNRFFMEGFLYRCHPRWQELRSLLVDGVIGDLRFAHAAFCFDANGKERLQQRAFGGGALMDVGCYPLSWLRWVAGSEPIATTCTAVLNDDGVDLTAAATLQFASGLLGTLHTTCVGARHVAAELIGSSGRIRITEPWRSMPGQAAFIIERDGGEQIIPMIDDGLNTYAREALTVAKYLTDQQAPAMTWDDSRGQARALDALRHAAGVRWDGE